MVQQLKERFYDGVKHTGHAMSHQLSLANMDSLTQDSGKLDLPSWPRGSSINSRSSSVTRNDAGPVFFDVPYLYIAFFLILNILV